MSATILANIKKAQKKTMPAPAFIAAVMAEAVTRGVTAGMPLSLAKMVAHFKKYSTEALLKSVVATVFEQNSRAHTTIRGAEATGETLEQYLFAA
jgi:hypothetical protein